MLDWAGATNLLYRITKQQILRFIEEHETAEVCGLGFYCDSLYGCVHLVADTEEQWRITLRDHKVSVANASPEAIRDYPDLYQMSPEVLRWDIGNWKYPAGLFPSASPDQRGFDTGWQPQQELLDSIGKEKSSEVVEEYQGILIDVCSRTLIRLFNERNLSALHGLEGFTVMGPDDPREAGFERKKHFDCLIDFERRA